MAVRYPYSNNTFARGVLTRLLANDRIIVRCRKENSTGDSTRNVFDTHER